MEDVSGIDEAGLSRLVGAFYNRVRTDPELGPIFNEAINDWPHHLEKLTDFWSSVMLGTGRYKGRPVPAHLKHKDAITLKMFERWLALWRQTTNELLPAGAAAALQFRAARIAESLQLAMFFQLPTEQGANRSTGRG